MSDFVIHAKDPGPFAGIGVAESFGNVLGDFKGTSWLDLAGDVAAFGIDILGLALDPIGTLAAAGVGWIIEHVVFLRYPLDVLAGNPRAVNARAESYIKVANEIADGLTEHNEAIAGIHLWKGDASRTYQQLAYDENKGIYALMKLHEDMAHGIQVAGLVIGTVRGIICDMISEFVVKLATKLLAGVGLGVVTAGVATAAAASAAAADAARVALKIHARLKRLVETLNAFLEQFLKNRQLCEAVIKALKELTYNLAKSNSDAQAGWTSAHDGRGNRPVPTRDPGGTIQKPR